MHPEVLTAAQQPKEGLTVRGEGGEVEFLVFFVILEVLGAGGASRSSWRLWLHSDKVWAQKEAPGPSSCQIS